MSLNKLIDKYFENDMKLNYIDAKLALKEELKAIKAIERLGGTSIQFVQSNLNFDSLEKKLDQKELRLKNSTICTDQIIKHQINKITGEMNMSTEYFIPERANASVNSEERRVINFINQKEKMICKLKSFAQYFNSDVLVDEERKLLYYSFFKEENVIQLSQRLFCHERTISSKSKKAVIKLMEQLVIDSL